MAEDYKPDAAPAGDDKKGGDDDGKICRTALERYHRWQEREQANIDAAYDDLTFYAGEDYSQWDPAELARRIDEKRPVLQANRLPQFVHQVTGDMRQMKPSIKTVPVDSRGDKETAETIAGMIRYVENRSDASAPYMSGADSQVVCGIGAWRVQKEYANESTFNQELRITGVDDAVAIAFDVDATLPTREDGLWTIVPVDFSREAFTSKWPEAPVEDFETLNNNAHAVGWFDKDMVRVAEYWVKKPIKRTLALMPDGAIIDLTDKDADEVAKTKAIAKRIEKRDGFKVCRYLITAAHVLEETDWPGLFIPIIPVIGEEVKIGTRVIRKGLVRDAKDPQRRYNYFITAQAETVALQPKAPFVGTVVNFEKYEEEWADANNKNFAYLPYTPDPLNGGGPPQRQAPPVRSEGISEGISLAAEDMKGTIGIYDAGLGQRSNETSGKAIMARQREGDVATFLYVDNWSRAIKHTGKILIDLIPHVYDTERKIRIMGEDGKVDLKDINKPVGMIETDEDGNESEVEHVMNDVTVGAYDVVLETGPSFSTKREEAKESMKEFIQGAPETAPVIMDLYAKAQDWPLADEIGKRFEAIAPPQVQKLIANQKKESGEEMPPPEPPSPEQQMAQAAAMEELKGLQLDNQKKEAEIAEIAQRLQAGQPVEQGDPLTPVKAQGEMQAQAIAADKGTLEVQILGLKVVEQELKNEILRAQLGGQHMGLQQGQEAHEIKQAQAATGLQHQQEDHQVATAERLTGLRHGEDSHEMAREGHEAKLKQMAQKPESRAGA
jgi:hypothetical protein